MSTYTLIIMRHAKSDWSADFSSDFARPVSTRGEKDLLRMAYWIEKQRLYPKRVLCSPAKRVQQTMQALHQALALTSEQIHCIDSIYDATLADLLAIITAHSTENPLMLIGHNPGLDQLLRHLSNTPPPLSDTGKLMTTSSIAVLDFSSDKFSTTKGCAQLQCLQRPRALA